MKNRTLNLATLVAMLSLAILVMTGCGNDKLSAPAEKVVNVDSLPLLFEKGQDTVIAGCASVDFKWMDCEGGFHPSKKFVPSYGSPIALQGEKADLSKAIGLSDGQYLVIRDGRDQRARLKNSFPPEAKSSGQKPVVDPVSFKKAPHTEEGFFPEWFWNFLKFLVAVLLVIITGLLGGWLIRRLAHWVFEPLARRQNRNNDNGGNAQAQTTRGDHHEHAHTTTSSTGDINTRGAVVIGRAGDMVERTTTVTERFVIRDNRVDRPNRRGNGGGYQGGDRREH